MKPAAGSCSITASQYNLQSHPSNQHVATIAATSIPVEAGHTSASFAASAVSHSSALAIPDRGPHPRTAIPPPA